MIDRIDVVGDPRLAAYARVGDHGWLRGNGLFVAEGRLVVERLIRTGRYRIASVLATPVAREALGAHLDHAGAPVLVCNQETLKGVTGYDFHRGCLALAHRPAVVADASWPVRDGPILSLDGIGNPDNVGGLFRTAAAFGAAGVIAGPATGDPLYRKAVRTSMGAVFDVPWISVDSWSTVMARLRRRGYRIVALTPHTAARPLDRMAVPDDSRVVLMLGAEGAGLTGDAFAVADERVRIPIVAGVDSLNVTVAAGIALHSVMSRAATSNREP